MLLSTERRDDSLTGRGSNAKNGDAVPLNYRCPYRFTNS